MLCEDLGKFLVTISNACVTVFGNDAMVTHVVPSPRYEKEGIILDITIKYRDWVDKDKIESKLKILDDLIYNPVLTPEYIMTKVNIVVVPLG